MECSTVHRSIKRKRASPHAESAEKKVIMSLALHDDTYGKARKTKGFFTGGAHMPSFVYKTSKERMKVALNMDWEGNHFMLD